MLFCFSPRRLPLLAAIVFVVAILTIWRTTYDVYLPTAHIPHVYQSHNGKGRPPDGATNTHEASPSTQILAGTKPSALPHDSHEEIQLRIRLLKAHWAPPSYDNHWPPYNEYGGADYDPNLWEGFDWDHNFYIRSGIKRLNREKPYLAKLVHYLPYPEYNSPQWKEQWQGQYVPCEGARGKLLNESADDWLMAYSAIPDRFPKPAVGDAGVIGIDINRCFDRYHRLGPYGYSQNKEDVVYDWSKPTITPNWTEVPWASLQDQCSRSNQDRYAPEPPSATMPLYGAAPANTTTAASHDSREVQTRKYHSRTALLIRTWSGYQYTPNDMQTIRSLITELSLLSGGEYQIFLFVNIKNKNADLQDAEWRQRLLDKHVPQEFHNISILWNEPILQRWYPDIGDWQVYWHQFMPLQWFSKSFPQFDFVWNWEMDVRYTGNHYHFLEQLSSFAKATPRKYLWERNQRFYFPDAHGSYEQWLADTDASIEAAIKNGSMKAIWGPEPYNKTHQKPTGPSAPHSIEKDKFEWGVDEEADLVTLQPIWDPSNTDWSFKDKIFNFVPGVRPHFSKQDPIDRYFTHTEFAKIPRRTYINTVSRFSKRQLHAMHLENQAGRTMQAEMWPATVALHHGLKAVYAPHPIWTDRKWPAWYMDAIFNSNEQEFARWSAGKDSVYNHDREANFAGWSWYYNAEFPRTLYRRWLGWLSHVGPEEQFPNNPLRALGGPEFEERGMEISVPEGSTTDWGVMVGMSRTVSIGGEGRMCLPPMLLHPVKRTEEPEGYLQSLEQDVTKDDTWSRAWKWILSKFDAS